MPTPDPRKPHPSEATNSFDVATDLLVIGSGAGGLSTALFASNRGLRVTLCEKDARIGGTTARSGGVVWIPNSAQAKAAGVEDSEDGVRTYLRGELGNYYRADLIDGFLASGPAAVAELESDGGPWFKVHATPDYHPSRVGGAAVGRSLISIPFDGRRLGHDFALVRPPIARHMVLGGMMLSGDEVPLFLKPFGSLRSMKHVVGKLARYAADRVRYSRGTDLRLGNALVARFVLALRKRGVSIRRQSRLLSLITLDGHVTGAVVEEGGKKIRISANRGVVIATGGFPHDRELIAEFSAETHPHTRSIAFAGNTGDGIKVAREAGAIIDNDLASPVLFTPASVLKSPQGQEETLLYGFVDRGKPGVIAVDPGGHRFVNESDSYHDIVAAMYAVSTEPDAKFHFVCESDFVRRYGLGIIRPGWPRLRRFADAGYIELAPTIEDLARRIGVPAETLAATVKRHNSFAAKGADEDFGRGENLFNKMLGDPKVGPNQNLAPILKPPFVALRIRPASLATTVGLKTDADGRVQGASGPISGLYACGNDLASIMRGAYPGGGSTLGPAIVFGYRVAVRASSVDGQTE
jgi:3-oxosteroid 1-dehydrogenase